MTEYAVGSLVKARGREWVVLPNSDADLLVLQPVTGAEREIAGVLTGLEDIQAATFPLPDPSRIGNASDWRLLRDAVRFGFRSSIGPFRSLAHVAVTPRAYQLVPLMMALKLDLVRLLIADDVGIGKTIESLLVARELLDQGTIKRLAVLCSPALAEQWQREMRDKFDIDAELVLTSTAARLERRCAFGQSLFDRYPFVVVSTDFIKADRRRLEFLDQAPELVIVDEAHGAAGIGTGRDASQRFELVSGLAADPTRHLMLLTATPHSGKGNAFRNLLSLLDDRFTDLPEDLSGPHNKSLRGHLARHFVQRRRIDIKDYVGEQTPFPERLSAEETYNLTPAYAAIFARVLRFARDTVRDEHGNKRQRIRWWSVLALLRSLASSPAAAAATLRNRAVTVEAADADEADTLGRSAVLDLGDDDALEGMDVVPGSDDADIYHDQTKTRRYYRDLALDVDELAGPANDAKLARLMDIVAHLVDAGHNPIIFCRFIPTAGYVADHLRRSLGRRAAIDMVTGQLATEEREARVNDLGDARAPRILVATDCVSEGVNLQDHFDAVIHYDLSWNPTRHEQREGRVDRYGQPSEIVRTITYYGADNGIDRIVLDVLLRKHAAIRKATGVSVPVPGDSDSLVEALMEGVVLRTDFGIEQLTFEGLEPQRHSQLNLAWENAALREKKSRHMFAQHAIKPEAVQQELERVRQSLGDESDLHRFLVAALPVLGGLIETSQEVLNIDVTEAPQSLTDAAPGRSRRFAARTSFPVADGETYLTRTHPFVETVADLILDASLRPNDTTTAPVARCGISTTPEPAQPTVAFLIRHRILLTTNEAAAKRPVLAEHCEYVAVRDIDTRPRWLTDTETKALLETGELHPLAEPQHDHRLLTHTLDHIDAVREHLNQRAEAVARSLAADHDRVRNASDRNGTLYQARPATTPDILGIYLLVSGGA